MNTLLRIVASWALGSLSLLAFTVSTAAPQLNLNPYSVLLGGGALVSPPVGSGPPGTVSRQIRGTPRGAVPCPGLTSCSDSITITPPSQIQLGGNSGGNSGGNWGGNSGGNWGGNSGGNPGGNWGGGVPGPDPGFAPDLADRTGDDGSGFGTENLA